MINKFSLPSGDLNIYHARLIADQQISIVLEFSHTLDENKLNISLDLLYKELPLLSCLIAVNGFHYRRYFGPGTMNRLTIITEPEDRVKELTHFISKPCDSATEPPLKILLIHSGSEDTLCIKSDHILTDAGGLKILLLLLGEAYTSGCLFAQINHNRGAWQIIQRFQPFTILKALQNAKLPIPGIALAERSTGIGESFIEHAFLDTEQFEKMKNESKKIGSTINDMLLTCLYQAIFRYFPEDEFGEYPVMVPVDMRRYLPSNQQMTIANLSSAVYPSLKRLPSENFRGIYERLKSQMDAFKKNQPGLGLMVLMSIGAVNGGKMLHEKYRIAANRGSGFINFTNCGILDSSCLAFGQNSIKQAYIVGPVQYGAGMIIAISTFRNKLHLTIQGKSDQWYHSFIRDFLHAILEHFY